MTPIHKSGSTSDLNNYRPISVLPLLSKIFEKCMCNRLMSYLDRFQLLGSKQFGFRRGRSTVDALLNFTEEIYSQLNNKQHTLGISVDYSKAFDTLSHDVLVRKLHEYGIRGIVQEWFASYLVNRVQCVKIGEETSPYRLVRTGVPQGSILGPVLFLVYINDLPSITDSANFSLFADDTTLTCSSHSYPDLIHLANQNLDQLHSWTVNNRLSLNAKKTSAILFSNRSPDIATPLQITINSVPILFENRIIFLGIEIDKDLSFSYHISGICRKLAKTIGILYCIRKTVPMSILIKLYNSLFYPVIVYCIILWGDTSAVHLRPLILLQKKVIRLITNSGYLSHTDPQFLQTGILPVPLIYKYFMGIHMYKLNLSNLISYPNHSYNTRNNRNAFVAFQRLSLTQKSISFCGPQLWNSIPSNIKESSSLQQFKRAYKSYLLSSIANSI